MTPLVIIGAGGFGRECYDVVVAMNRQEPRWDFLGFVDDAVPPSDVILRLGAKWLGTTADLSRHAGAAYVVGVGSPGLRRALVGKSELAGLEAATLIHPSATFGLDVTVEEGCVVCSHVSVTTNVVIGAHTHLNLNCTVGHDTRVARFCTVNPGASVSGNVELEEGVLVGTNSAILQGRRISRSATVGAGAVVTADVGARAVVVGVPARDLRQGS